MQVAALLGLACRLFAGQLPTVSVTVSGDGGPAGFTADAVAGRLVAYISTVYEGILAAGPAGAGSQGTTGAASATASARVTLAAAGDGISARTELVSAGTKTSRLTVVPHGSPAALIPAIAGDLAYLVCASVGFANVPLSPPPALRASLSTDELAILTGWNPDEMQPIAIAGTDGSLTLAFPHGWLTLGPLFSLTQETARDLLAQGFGREPLQLSGIVKTRGNGLALLSEREKKIAWVDPWLGVRDLRAAPGLAAGHAQWLGGRSLCVLSGGSLAAWRTDGSPATRIGGSAWTSAFTTDWEGNIWTCDARETRIRVFAPDGREVHSIRPLVRVSSLQFPQQIAVLGDGSFLLGGAGEVWKFRASGTPVWRLARIAGLVSEALPSSFQIAVDRRTGAFTLLDGPSRRLLSFAGDAPLPGMTTADGDGLLLALQDGMREERRGAGSEARSAANLAILRRKTALLAGLAASFREELLYDQAERAVLKASESARETLAEDPADGQAARALDELVALRRELRDSLTQEPGVGTSRARAVARLLPSGRSLEVSLAVRNTGTSPLAWVRISLTAPGLSLIPSLAQIGSLAAGQEKQVEMSLQLIDSLEHLDDVIPAASLVSWERGAEGGTTPIRLTLHLEPGAQAETASALRDELLWQVDPGDRLVRAAVTELSSGSDDSLVAAAHTLDVLGRLRQAASAATAPTATIPPSPGPASARSVRATLRSLSPGAVDWSLLVADILTGLGFPVGVLAWQDAAVVLVDTGVGLGEALAGLPALAQEEPLLRKLSRNGHLCVPLSGDLLPSPSQLTPSVFALLAGLRACRERGVAPRAAAWRGDAGLAAPGPEVAVPFLVRFAFVPEPLDRDTLASRIRIAMEQKK